MFSDGTATSGFTQINEIKPSVDSTIACRTCKMDIAVYFSADPFVLNSIFDQLTCMRIFDEIEILLIKFLMYI